MRIAASLLFLAAACGSSKPTSTTPGPTPEPRPADTGGSIAKGAPDALVQPAKPVTNKSLSAVGLDPDALDRTADPCDDFYQFACGGWVAKTEIPADKPLAMRSFVSIADRNLDYEHGILEQARTNPGQDKLLQQLGAFYGSCMDEATIAKQGLRPIQPMLATIARVKDAKSLSAAVAALHTDGIDALFNLSQTQDPGDARSVIAGIDQGGIGLPDRDYFLKDDKKMVEVRAAYQDYVAKLLAESGDRTSAKDAADVIALETEIAKVSKDKVARRDPKGTYNKIDRDGVAKAMSHFDWNGFWKTLNLATVKDVTVTSPEFLAGVDALIVSTKPAVWRNYLTATVLRATAPFLTKKLDDLRFAFRSKLTGQQAQEPRWKRCTEWTDGDLGDLLGQVFVRDKFGGASKSAAEDEVHAIVASMTANLAALPWMDPATRKKALEKLDVMTYQIGFPKKWRSYDFKVDPKQFAHNDLVASRAEHARQLAKIGKPVDKDDWQMSAPTVNAYYDPQLNGMVFPAGILQPPFYSVESSTPVNLGAMGMVVGHELTHGFDDQGAQYDANGNLANWWLAETEKLFKQRTQCVIDQYSEYPVPGGGKVNGHNTLGENIADIGGLKLAFTAYRALRSSAPDTVVADGFTEDQQFFLSFGQAWCAKLRPDYEQMLATVDVHSPARWRVNGGLSATPAFAKAFRCKAGSKMAPANACVVW